MYSNGEGLSHDNKEARKWFQLAAEQGNTLAQEKLDEILNKKSLWKKIKDIF
jgi:TPR repeat protein